MSASSLYTPPALNLVSSAQKQKQRNTLALTAVIVSIVVLIVGGATVLLLTRPWEHKNSPSAGPSASPSSSPSAALCPMTSPLVENGSGASFPLKCGDCAYNVSCSADGTQRILNQWRGDGKQQRDQLCRAINGTTSSSGDPNTRPCVAPTPLSPSAPNSCALGSKGYRDVQITNRSTQNLNYGSAFNQCDHTLPQGTSHTFCCDSIVYFCGGIGASGRYSLCDIEQVTGTPPHGKLCYDGGTRFSKC